MRHADVVDLVQARPELSATRVVALNPQSLDDVLHDVRQIGDAAGAAHAAELLVSSLRMRIDRIASRTATLLPTQRPRVVCIEWVQPLMAAGNWTPQLIELAGGSSGLAAAGRHSGYITCADLQAFDPEVLLVAPCGFDLARSVQETALLVQLPGFAELSAIKSGRAYVLDGKAYLNRSGPRLVESLEILAHLIQQQCFEPPPLKDAWQAL